MLSALLWRSPRAFYPLPVSNGRRFYTSTVPKLRWTAPKPKIQRAGQAAPQVKAPVPAAVIQARNKAAIAEQILDAGRDVIYKAPSHGGMLFAAWAVFASGALGCVHFMHNGFHDSEAMKERGLPWWISPVYILTMGFMGLCSGVFLAQSFSFITAIKLVKDGGAIKLLVSQRPWFPLWRHHRFLIEPSQLQIDRKVAFFAQQPAATRTKVGQQAVKTKKEGNILQRMVVTPFLIMRKLFFHEGVLSILIPTGKDGTKERWVRLDLDGEASNNGKDLLDVATIRP